MIRVAIFSSPLVLGLALPFLMALGRERKWPIRRRAGILSLGAAAWILFLTALWPFSGEPIRRLLETSCFLLAFSAFLFGLHLFFESILPSFAQPGCAIVVILMLGTLFYFDPIVEHAQTSKVSREAFQSRVDWAIECNPYAVLAYSVFEEDLLTRKALYSRTLLADLQRSYPDWSRAALGYLLLGFWLCVLRIGLLTVRWRFRGR